MVQKKEKNQAPKDLTRIEDLAEFFHEEDSELDERFDSPVDLASLEQDNEAPPEIPSEDLMEETSVEFLFEENSDLSELETTPYEFSLEENSDADEQKEVTEEEFSEELNENRVEPLEDNSSLDFEPYKQTPPTTPEKFSDVTTFAKNFSYGQVQGAGNPPYTLIARHIKFKEDAEHIVELLKELALINDQNEADTIRSLEYGSLIVPQISEYCAIVLAHKLRRFDLDLEVGLSDEVHPSKELEGNPRGLLKKESLKQNRSESFKLSDADTSIKEIIVSTTSSVPGFFVKHYIGVQTTFCIVEEAELEKLQFVQKSERENSVLYDYEAPEATPLSSKKAFSDYQNSFSYLYEDLTQQLKQKALREKANALLGLSFQLSPLQFDRSEKRLNAYQITCSATLAILGKENA